MTLFRKFVREFPRAMLYNNTAMPVCWNGRRGGLKIKFVHKRHGGFAAAVELRVGHCEQRRSAVSARCGGSERYQGFDIRSAPYLRPDAAYKESLGYQHDRRSQQELYQPHCSVISLKEGRQRESPHHVPH